MPFAWIGATFLGALVPAALISTTWGGPDLSGLSLLAFAVTLSHALFIGLPVALLYRCRRWRRPELAVATGFLIGAVPIGMLSWPISGWPEQLRLLGLDGGRGAAGALGFWLVLYWAGALDEAPASFE
jgi:hypothetical protein